MKKKIFIIISFIVCMIWLVHPLLANFKEKVPLNQDNEIPILIKRQLSGKNFIFLKEKSKSSKNPQFSFYIAPRYRLLTSKKEDLPILISGLSGGRVAEYLTAESYPGADFYLKGVIGEKNYIDVEGSFIHPDEQEYYANLDIGRIIRSITDVNRFIHRLDHDPLTNVKDYHEFVFIDSNPTDEYITTRTEIKNKTELVIPQFPQMKFKANVRYMIEKGHQQARTLDVCFTCHIDAQTQEIDQRTMEFILGTEVNVKPVTVSYSFLSRRFDDQAAPLTHVYTGLPWFAVLGKQEFAHIPDSDKTAHNVKAKIEVLNKTDLFGSYTISKVKNKHNNGELDLKNFLSRLSSNVIKGLRIAFNFQKEKYDNHIKNTISRDTSMAGVDVFYRVPKLKVNLRGKFEWQKVKRSNFEIGETKRYITYLSASFYPSSKLNGYVRYKRKDIDNPFALLEDKSPLAPTQELLMTSLYTDINELICGLNLTPVSRFSIGGNFFWKSAKNKDINSKESSYNLIANLWCAPINNLNFTVSYTLLNSEVKNNLIYGTQYGFAIQDIDVPFDRKMDTFLVALNYNPIEKLYLMVDYSFSKGKAHFDSSNIAIDIAQLTDLDISHIRISSGFSYYFTKNIALLGKYKFENYKDAAWSPEYNGKFHIIYFGFGWKF